MTTKKSEKENEINFEEAMKKLEDIAEKLEKDELSLDESMKQFEEGMQLSKQCKEILDDAEKKITILIDNQEKDFVSEE